MKGKKTQKPPSFSHSGVNYKLKDCIQVRGEASAVPFIGQIRDIEVPASGKSREVNVQVAWYYRPEEAQGGRKQFHGEKELFKSEHLDWCLAVTIEGKCQVHSLRAYQALKKVEVTDYFSRFTYMPTTHEFRPDRVPVYCVCELPYNPDAYMVQCEACEDWFHPQCIGYSQAQVEPIKNFACPECQQAGRDAKRLRTEADAPQPAAPAPVPSAATACT